MHADDLMMMVDTQTELQLLLDVCNIVGTHLELYFNPRKCVLVVWGAHAETQEIQRSIQGNNVDETNVARYLDMLLSRGRRRTI